MVISLNSDILKYHIGSLLTPDINTITLIKIQAKPNFIIFPSRSFKLIIERRAHDTLVPFGPNFKTKLIIDTGGAISFSEPNFCTIFEGRSISSFLYKK